MSCYTRADKEDAGEAINAVPYRVFCILNKITLQAYNMNMFKTASTRVCSIDEWMYQKTLTIDRNHG